MTDQGLRNLHLSESCQNPKFATETKETFTSRDGKKFDLVKSNFLSTRIYT